MLHRWGELYLYAVSLLINKDAMLERNFYCCTFTQLEHNIPSKNQPYTPTCARWRKKSLYLLKDSIFWFSLTFVSSNRGWFSFSKFHSYTFLLAFWWNAHILYLTKVVSTVLRHRDKTLKYICVRNICVYHILNLPPPKQFITFCVITSLKYINIFEV